MLYFSKLKIFSIFIVILIGFIFFIPNFVNHEYFNKNIKKFNLGLDLQGGSYLLLEIDSKPLVQQKIQNKILEIKKELRKNKISYSSFNLNNKIVSFDIKSNSDKILLVLNKNKINYLPDGSKEFNIEQNNGKIILKFSNNFISNIKKNALEQSLEIVRNRIDEIGTKEPTIIAQGKDRILVELPGLRDPSGIKSLLGKTAKLTFRFLVNNEKAEFGFELLNDKSNNEKKYKVEKKII
ncbi:MAG: protein translocase subunit SecD, partial [Candidatus Pelagibacter sp.]